MKIIHLMSADKMYDYVSFLHNSKSLIKVYKFLEDFLIKGYYKYINYFLLFYIFYIGRTINYFALI